MLLDPVSKTGLIKILEIFLENKRQIFKTTRVVQNIKVVHVCQINFFYVFVLFGPILRHLGEFEFLPGENTRFLLDGCTENPHTVLHGRFLISHCFVPLN